MVKVGNTYSSWKIIFLGIPQLLILSPFYLFVWLILFPVLRHNNQLFSYA